LFERFYCSICRLTLFEIPSYCLRILRTLSFRGCITAKLTRLITRKVAALELAFESRRLRTICEMEAEAKSELGDAVAEVLKHRLADLRAASSVKDLLAGRPRVLEGSGGKHMAVELADDYRLVFTSNHITRPKDSANDINWGWVTRIRLLGIDR
jgi:proteic killer suppression protein